MGFLYRSTRDKNETVTASQAILQGLAHDGGLFVPDEIPVMDLPLEKLAEMDYRGIAYEVMSRMLTDFTEEELKYCINSAYDSKFDDPKIAPLVKHHGTHFLELFHGRSGASLLDKRHYNCITRLRSVGDDCACMMLIIEQDITCEQIVAARKVFGFGKHIEACGLVGGTHVPCVRCFDILKCRDPQGVACTFCIVDNAL